MTSRDLLITGARNLAIELTPAMVDACLLYQAELDKWNRKINLTAIRNEQDSIVKNMLDSLSYIKGLDPLPGLKIIDLGSGAGFPGLPIKIARPDVSVALIESVAKKASFLRHIIRTLQIDVPVMEARVESLYTQLSSAFHVVTARAFANMRSVVEAGRPFLRKQGVFVLSRGINERLTDLDLAELNIQIKQRLELKLPFSDHKRAIWVLSIAS
ncbi:MAG TPA: 16S rRNA (guanine(527)-N(7))-methyltransferase RsmG [Nitrospirota bacterium]|nr:16S rRNA (guanine(527)-N(7))-methyltransferase RsmG [Nitrospirota bacterium]